MSKTTEEGLKQRLIKCNAMLLRRPDNHELHRNKAHFLCKLGRTQEAIESYSKAIKLDPDNRMYLAQRAKLYVLTEQPDLAVLDWKKILTLPKTDDFEQDCLEEIEKVIKAIPCMEGKWFVHNDTTEFQEQHDALTVLGDVA